MTAAVSYGRGVDVVGAPIDFSRMPRPAGGSAVRASGRLNLPAFAQLPSRLPLVRGSLSSRFGLRRHPIHGDIRAHNGVDLAAPTGTPVYASASGYVSSATWNGGYGLMVTLEHGGGVQTRYGHLSGVAVQSGQMISAGSVLGYVGSTGNSTGPHLHYEIRNGGRAVDPLRGR